MLMKSEPSGRGRRGRSGPGGRTWLGLLLPTLVAFVILIGLGGLLIMLGSFGLWINETPWAPYTLFLGLLWLLGWGASVEVLSPLGLRARLSTEAWLMFGKHSVAPDIGVSRAVAHAGVEA